MSFQSGGNGTVSADGKPLRITLLTHSTLPRGGVVHALALGDALAEAGHHVRLLAPVQPGEALFRAPRSARCRFIGVPATPIDRIDTTNANHSADHATHASGNDSESLVQLVQRRIDDWGRYFDTVPEAFDADVFHAQDSISANALANLVESGRLSGFVRTVHHLDAFAHPQLAAWQRRGFRAAAQVCCVSEVWRDRLLFDEGIGAMLVRNGVDRYRFSPARDAGDVAVRSLRVGCIEGSDVARNEERDDGRNEARSEERNKDLDNASAKVGTAPRPIAGLRAPIFLSVGGVEARKNTVNALAAYILWRKEAGEVEDAGDADLDARSSFYSNRHRAQWWIAGGASLLDHREYGQKFLNLAEAAGLGVGRTLDSGADIVLIGRVDDTHMPALFRAADALLFPSLVEGFGLVVLEALSVGTPVITSRIAPFTEYLPDAAVEWVDPLDPGSIAAAMRRAVPIMHSPAPPHTPAHIGAFAASEKPAANAHAASGKATEAQRHRAEQRQQAGFAVADSFSWANSAAQHSDLYRRWQHGRALGVARDTRAETSDVSNVSNASNVANVANVANVVSASDVSNALADTSAITVGILVSEQESHHA